VVHGALTEIKADGSFVNGLDFTVRRAFEGQ
jgi:hypothetical protein